jgi:hypothetical protein
MTATSPVLKQIAGLPKLSHGELKALWREYFGVEPPTYRRGFLVRGLAHRLQELTYGGLKPTYQARLEAMIEGGEKPNGAGRSGRRPRQEVNLLEGTKLLRDWRGVTHEVTVIDGGYGHQGRRYRSLSAVARSITGTQWSGPRLPLWPLPNPCWRQQSNDRARGSRTRYRDHPHPDAPTASWRPEADHGAGGRSAAGAEAAAG